MCIHRPIYILYSLYVYDITKKTVYISYIYISDHSIPLFTSEVTLFDLLQREAIYKYLSSLLLMVSENECHKRL